MNLDAASRGIGTGLGIIGMGIGLRFMKDITDDFRTKHRKSSSMPMPKIPKIKKIKWKY